MYAMLTGELPFDATSKESLYNDIHNREIDFPDKVTETWRVLIRGMLQREPMARWDIARVTEYVKSELPSAVHNRLSGCPASPMHAPREDDYGSIVPTAAEVQSALKPCDQTLPKVRICVADCMNFTPSASQMHSNCPTPQGSITPHGNATPDPQHLLLRESS
jgi:hypothetical protein